MQKEVNEKTAFLDENGNVVVSGWSKKDVFIYERDKVAKNSLRIKEWDFWEVTNPDFGVIMNIYDIGMFGLADFTFTDFNTGEVIHSALLKLFTRGSVNMPPSWRYSEPLIFKKKTAYMKFSYEKESEISANGNGNAGETNKIHLEIDFPGYKARGIKGEIVLNVRSDEDLMVNLIPFKDPKKFVYAQKMACLPANGEIFIDGERYEFTSENLSYGVLDWTRAVFPYNNHWKWCIASGRVNGVDVGFNIDYGFGTESSKSMIFYDHKGYHLDEVYYNIDPEDIHKDIKITSPDGRVDLTLHPKFPEKSGIDILIMKMKGILVYGFFTGKLVLDGGEEIIISEEDRLFGWAEEFSQRW